MIKEDEIETENEEDEQPSPLYEAIPESLDELFTRIDKNLVLGLPREITDTDIDRVVKYYREQRVRFVQDQANFIKPGKRAKTNKDIERIIGTLEYEEL